MEFGRATRRAAGLSLLAAAMMSLGGHEVLGQAWPSRPLRIIVSQAAGGTPDIICRLIAERLSVALGQQVIVENRPGGGNIVGAQAAARSAPDGYTLFFGTAAALTSNVYTFKSLPYDPAADFTPVSMVGRNPFMVLVHPSVPVTNLKELIAYEKTHPNQLNFATDGPRNFSGLLAAWVNKLGGMSIQQISYATMPQGVQDAIAGRVQLIIASPPTAGPLIATERMRPLAVSTVDRIPGYESVPPIAETFPGFDFIGWFTIVAPTGTPPDIVTRLNREMDVILKLPEIKRRMTEVGFYNNGSDTPEGLGRFITSQREMWSRAVGDLGLQPE